MPYCLIKIGYDSSFHGVQYQPGIRTVMGEINKITSRMGIRKVYFSSRTDSFVRSSTNLIEAEFGNCMALASAINSIDGIYVLSYANVDEYVPLRGRFVKEYLYFSTSIPETDALAETISEFMKSDFSKFSKDKGKKVYLDKIDFYILSFGTILSFKGKAFSWNFVRISSECILKKALGEINKEEWDKIIEGEINCKYKGKGKNLILYKSILPFDMINFPSDKLDELEFELIKQLIWIRGMDSRIMNKISQIADVFFDKK